ncbi:MAG: T9SS type A sorting domain-containing protein, partial [Sphingobacteriales bacterium]
MKKTLLSIALLTVMATSAQTVNNFYPITTNQTTYTLADSQPALDETPSGENAAWSFINLTGYGYSETTVLAATSQQQSAYPGTTSVVSTQGASEFFLANALNGGVSLTGASSSGIMLNYSTDNFNLGTFPKAYGNSVTDNVAGTFTGGGVSGTFTGTGTTSVDGYGSLNTNIGDDGTPATITVTRLKIQQNLTLSYSGIPIGTLTQVMYSYYAATPNNAPVFRTLTAVINLPLMNINETQQSIESYYDPLMSVYDPANTPAMAIAPNPVKDVLHLEGTTDITGVTVFDAAGRMVLQSGAANDIAVSHLSAGIYYATVTAGTAVK